MLLEKVLKYCPSLNPITGSVTASILMCQLEYWFDKTKGKPFYKFLEPCEDECYKVGDSWTEELGFTCPEFRTAFAKIGKVYQSKTDYVNSPDPFEGKFYLSYRDRIKKRTYYLRNEKALQALLLSLQSACGYSEEYTKKSSLSEEDYKQVLALFHTTCPSLPQVPKLSATCKKHLNALWTKLTQSGQDVWVTLRQVFEQVEHSDFLCGRTGKSNWYAFLEWIVQPGKFFDILKGKYAPRTWKPGGASTRPPSPSTHASFTKALPAFLRMETHNFDLEQLEAQERLHQARLYAEQGFFSNLPILPPR